MHRNRLCCLAALLIGLLLTVGIPPAGSVAAAKSTADDQDTCLACQLNQEGIAWYAEGNVKAAQASFERAHELNPDLVEPYFYLAAIYLDQGRSEEAQALIEQGLQLAPDVAWGYWLRAQLAGDAGDWQRAADDLSVALAQDTAAAATADAAVAGEHAARALMYANLGDAAAALADLEQALASNPWDFDSYTLYRQVRQVAAVHREVVSAQLRVYAQAQTAAEHDLARGRILYSRGVLFYRPDDIAAARAYYDAALAADPTLAAAYHARSLTYLAEWPPEDQVVATERQGDIGSVTLLDPATGEEVVIDVDEYDRRNENRVMEINLLLDQATADIEKALALLPTDAVVVHDLGVIHFWRAQFTSDERAAAATHHEALTLLSQAVTLAPDWYAARLDRAVAAAIVLVNDGGETNELLADADWLIAQNPADGAPHVLRWLALYINAEAAGRLAFQRAKSTLDENYAAYLERTPSANLDDPLTWLVDRVQPAGPTPQDQPLVAGHLEMNDEQRLDYVNPAGFRIAQPEGDIAYTWSDAVCGDRLMVRYEDAYQRLDLVVLPGELPAAAVDDWIATQLVPYWPDATRRAAAPLELALGEAWVVDLGAEEPDTALLLPAGDHLFVAFATVDRNATGYVLASEIDLVNSASALTRWLDTLTLSAE